MSAELPRIVILASGSGTNAEAVMSACDVADLSAQVVAVITNNANAGVLDRARRFGVATETIIHESRDAQIRAEEDAALIRSIEAYDPDVVVLAGWMRILGAVVGARFPMINLHPAKPGEFAGTKAIERAFAAFGAGEINESGVMVHWVPDGGVDVGPTILSEVVEIRHDDDLDVFAERMHRTEHRLLVEALRVVFADRDTTETT